MLTRAKIITGEVEAGEFHSELELTPEVRAVLAQTMKRPPSASRHWYIVGRGATMKQATRAAEKWVHFKLPNTIVVFSEIA